MRYRSTLLAVFITALLAFLAFQGALVYFGSEEREKAAGRLSLYLGTVTAELERFAHLTFVLAEDPFVIAAASGGETEQLNARLKAFAAEAGLDAIYLMETDGLTIAASNFDVPSSFLGQNYGFRQYFRDAMEGRQGRFYAIGATTGLPGYFIADPVRGPDGGIAGVIAIKLDLSKLEESWRRSGEEVLLVNADGVVMLASDSDWRYRVLSALTEAQRTQIEASRQFSGQALEALDWSNDGGNARIGGSERIHLTSADLPHGWVLHYLVKRDQAVTRSWLSAAFVVVVAGLVFIALQVQRARRVGAALARSELEEAALRQANERLAVEIEDRRTAERQLKRAQGELERASRLAALGQLAASVTHELGQPIAAMRNHLTAAEIGATAGVGLIGKIAALVDRMEGTTRQLKFFARSEAEPFGDADLGDAMRASLALVEPNVQATGVTVMVELPDTPLVVRGNQLRIEQVMTNLLRNAIDASEDRAHPELHVSAGTDGDLVWFEVRDNGHGLGDSTLADLAEPFVTTRESGRGMGLGLAIAAGIVLDHGGVMTAENAESGGASFRVCLPAARAAASGEVA
ncbi:MAG: sensor histidine kinase [Silicimonas sp.]|nr:sensor histidine kinase [Silicimonas sp.]